MLRQVDKTLKDRLKAPEGQAAPAILWYCGNVNHPLPKV